jgi:hypothetical protein
MSIALDIDATVPVYNTHCIDASFLTIFTGYIDATLHAYNIAPLDAYFPNIIPTIQVPP